MKDEFPHPFFLNIEEEVRGGGTGSAENLLHNFYIS